ncbi:MAG TPA: mandelate racemase/muconate lactonizing enzyme family protein [Beijerinckiaceae bacterium]|jgi:D-galactarolactone cycloisomerase|nr:mandelate racemase/muconate lactonizing enzyme family protein [Microvirga sp.]HZB39154.1 mandelate racemase/muconate lactonizing enzyme family protein [Beijerinckiaceae bacterium]
MKIAAVNTYVLSADLETPFAYSQAWYATRMALIVEVVADHGLSGFGEVYGPPRPNRGVVEAYAPLLVGEDPFAIERHWQRLYNHLRDHGQRGLAIQALSGIDIALWDLKGKALGLPVHVLMGGPIRERVRAYATGLYRRDRPDHEAYLREEAASYVEAGFTAMKLKTGWGVAEDVRLTRALRDEIGGEVELMVDANHAYDAVDALAYVRKVEDLDIGWFEEPVAPEDYDGYREVKAGGTIPVAGGECSFTRYGFRRLLTERLVDIAQPDTCAAGGLSECKKIADMAQAFGVRYVPHCWGTGIARAAALQLLAVLPHNPPGLHATEPLLEFDMSEHPIRDAVTTEPIVQEDGFVRVPTGPGLGIEVDRATLERFRA